MKKITLIFSILCLLVYSCNDDEIDIVTPPVTTSTTFTVTSFEASAYVFNGGGFTDAQNPSITLTRGMTYGFVVNAANHPFFLKTAQTTGQEDQYNSGVSNNGTENGTLTFVVPTDAPDLIYYQCGNHSPMTGQINIVD